MVLFSRFGLLLCALMLTTLLYTNFFLAPLLLLVGPRARTSGRVVSEVELAGTK